MPDLGHIIQLSIAPVFLLTGIAGLLSVLSTRLGRITDRARVVERQLPGMSKVNLRELMRTELAILWRRAGLINLAIRLCTAAALLVCLLVVCLFVGAFSPMGLSVLIATAFVASMLVLMVGLLCFLREIGMATRSLKEGMEFVGDD